MDRFLSKLKAQENCDSQAKFDQLKQEMKPFLRAKKQKRTMHLEFFDSENED